ncbi:uncharacterized protein SOCEGT47_005820 [Sorangium cellulosum]|uniref:GAF domain-containing protein n=1 Tax=Sorangium cellulosum TaxID=56 RepID=A0A4P2PTY3_SORCE|nr:GAF domain-containing protein [Sorangium cellulosum]AUX20119.1 uncharacterized protein SOCEGT47_005820 [Sorangium cellulosum]
MRWFVEISSPGQNAQPSRKLCVEAPQWQPALQRARALRGDDGPLSNFSVDLLESGYRAIDPVTRVRYVVQRAPDNAALTDGAEPPAGAPPSAAASPNAAEAEAPLPRKRPVAATVPFISLGAALLVQDLAGAAQQPEPGAAAAPEPSALPPFELVSQREENPSERSPLTYRELVYAVAPGTPRELVKALLIARLDEARQRIDDARPGKFVHIAVFDHVFKERPQRGPLATLAWKDWRSDEPEIQFRPRTGTTAPPPPMTAAAPAPAAAAPAAAAPAPAAAAPAEEPRAPSSPRATPAPAEGRPRMSSRPPPRRSSRPPKAGRLSGDDLIAELFEACSDLHFLHDTLEGADFVLALTLDKIPCAVGLVSLFDIDRREFVLVRQHGGKGALLSRLPERAPLAQAALRSRQAAVVPDVSRDERALNDWWTPLGVTPRSVVCAPVELAGRYLGLLELGDPLDGGPFSEGDGHALTYIGQQFAEFVGARGVVLDPKRVTAGAKRAAR